MKLAWCEYAFLLGHSSLTQSINAMCRQLGGKSLPQGLNRKIGAYLAFKTLLSHKIPLFIGVESNKHKQAIDSVPLFHKTLAAIRVF